MKCRYKKQHFLVDNGTYPFDILVCVGMSHSEVVKVLEDKVGKLTDDNFQKLHMVGNGRTLMLEGGQTIIQVRDLPEEAHFHANFAHEIFHAVEFLFNAVGSKHDISSGETWAYQIGFITKNIYRKLKVSR